MIRERAMKAQPLELAQAWGLGGGGFLMQMCYELQLDAGDGPFFLSSRDAGRLMHIPDRTASRYLAVLAQNNILQVVEKGTAKTRQATTFRFLGRTEDEGSLKPSPQDRPV